MGTLASGYEPSELLATTASQQDDTDHPPSISQVVMEESKSYSIKKLNESNYCSWSQIIESHLDDQDLWDVVTGKEVMSMPLATTEDEPSQIQQPSTATTSEDHEARNG